MSNAQFKSAELPKTIKPGQTGAIAAVSAPSPLMSAPWKTALRGADFVPAAYRLVYSQHSGGSNEWAVGNFATDPLKVAPDYPDPETYRIVARTRFELAPGCALRVRAVAVRSGMTEAQDGDGDYPPFGAGGSVRVSLDYTNVDSDTDSTEAELQLPASNETDGYEPTTAGGSWGALLFKAALLVHPDAAINSASEQAKWSEWPTVDAVFEQRGGARVIHTSLTEVPLRHVAAHTDEDVSIHGWPVGDQVPEQRPTIEAKDGATYEEHRFGVHRGLRTAERQTRRAGPIIAAWSSYTEAGAEIGDTENDAVSVASTTFVGLSIGSSVTSWSTNNPGHDIAGHYARPMPENLSERLDGAAAIPVRCRVYARFTTTGSNTGYVKFQSSARSWVTVAVPQNAVTTSYAWHDVTGWLECTAAPDDDYPVLCDFARVTGGTMEVRDWAVEYGEYEVGA
jgi:hypothetical protein